MNKNLHCYYAGISCPHLDTSTMTRLIDCNDCSHYKDRIKVTGALPNLNLNKMKDKTIIKALAIFAIFVSILLMLIITFSKKRINELKQTEQLYITIADSLTKTINKNNQQTATIKVLQSDKIKLFTTLASNDSTILHLQNVVNLYEKKVGKLNTALVLSNETNLKLQDSIKNLIIGYITDNDTPGVIYPIYQREINKKWYNGSLVMGLDTTALNLKIRNEYEVTIGSEKISMFKKQEYANVTNLNPDTETKTMKVYQKTETKDNTVKKMGVAGVIGLIIGLII